MFPCYWHRSAWSPHAKGNKPNICPCLAFARSVLSDVKDKTLRLGRYRIDDGTFIDRTDSDFVDIVSESDGLLHAFCLRSF